jgi:hypothetical protein
MKRENNEIEKEKKNVERGASIPGYIEPCSQVYRSVKPATQRDLRAAMQQPCEIAV